MICRKCIVKGRVQGVWFRDTTRQKAQSLGLHGHAVNLPDGSVEVLACGNRPAVDDLCEWLWQGPPMADVSDVSCEETGSLSPDDFSIG